MNKSNLQVNVRNVLTIVLVPVVLGAIGGFFIQPHVAWLTPVFTALITLFIITVGMLVYRFSQNDTTAVGGWFMGLLVMLGAIGYFLVHKYTRWDWWIGPAIGLAAGLILTLIWVLLRRYRATRRVESVQVSHAPPRPASDDVRISSVSESVRVALGLPTGSDTIIDIGALTKALQERAVAEKLAANAQILGEIREFLKLGIIDADQVNAEVCRLCGIKPKVTQPSVQQPRTQPERPQVTTVKWDDI